MGLPGPPVKSEGLYRLLWYDPTIMRVLTAWLQVRMIVQNLKLLARNLGSKIADQRTLGRIFSQVR